MIDRIIDYEATGAAGVEDGVISVFSTRAVKVGGRECSCVKGSSKDGFVFSVCTLMDYSIVDIEVADILGNPWPLICANEREWVVAGITGVVTHPLASWVVSVPFLGLSRSMSHPCWISVLTEEGRWGVVDQLSILFFHVWVDDVSEDADVAEV